MDPVRVPRIPQPASLSQAQRGALDSPGQIDGQHRRRALCRDVGHGEALAAGPRGDFSGVRHDQELGSTSSSPGLTMCGICGIVRMTPPGRVDEDVLRRMRDTMVHRGPDDEGLFISGNVGLGHRRLSIVDLSGGHQPMANADETIWITYNGELYNFRELRAEMEARGHAFRTKSDTEVVLRAYEMFGDRCVEHLHGMFAFAIWDGQRQRLLLARDRLGIKP